MAKRVYELSQIKEAPSECPIQPSFRHLCNILQINEGDVNKARDFYKDQIKTKRDERRFTQRSACALYWLKNYAPEEFKFNVNKSAPSLNTTEPEKKFLQNFTRYLDEEGAKAKSDKELHEKLYEVIHATEDIEPGDAFKLLYQLLISQEKGPKLAGFIRTIGVAPVNKLIKELL